MSILFLRRRWGWFILNNNNWNNEYKHLKYSSYSHTWSRWNNNNNDMIYWMHFIICVIALLLTIYRWTITLKFITKYIILFKMILWKLLQTLSIVMWKNAFSHHRYEQWYIIEKGHGTLKVLLEYTDGLIFMLHKYNDVIMNFLLLLFLLLLYLKKSYLAIYLFWFM